MATDDAFIDPWRTARSPAASALVSSVVSRVEANETRQRRRKPADQARFVATIAALVCDLAYRHLGSPGVAIAVPLARRVLDVRDRYVPADVIGPGFPGLLALLATPGAGLVEIRKGGTGDRQRSTVRASPRLQAMIAEAGMRRADFGRRKGEEVLILKAERAAWDSPSGKRIQYDDTPETVTMRAEVAAVNAWLAGADIAVTGDDAGAHDVTDRRLVRTFNNGRWTHGGRLFGGFWQPMSKEARRRLIRLDGEETVTLDFGQLHPRLAYAHAGITPPMADLYGIPQPVGPAPWARGAVKQAINARLFDRSGRTRFPKGMDPKFPKGTRWATVQAAIEVRHAPIAHLFGRGFGFYAMLQESRILLAVLNACRSAGITALPIHDAVLVPMPRAEEAHEIMLGAHRETIGAEGVVTMV